MIIRVSEPPSKLLCGQDISRLTFWPTCIFTGVDAVDSSAGGASVVGHILQASEQSRLILLAEPFGGRLLLFLQGDTSLLSGRLARSDHAVNLSQPVGWAGADVVEDLVSRSNRAAGLVWRDVDGVIVG